ncbi:hypothetical protein AB1484_11420 [Parafrankia sp. FMc6]|uniref:hypothetical protein n=1 Tax=Parafrankia soli TaxID=2599596 RepID=UPI0034D4036B
MPRDDQHRADAMLRGLVGAGRSRLSLSAAMRARDVSRPTEADLAWAEQAVVLRHAHPAPAGPGGATDPAAGRAATRSADSPGPSSPSGPSDPSDPSAGRGRAGRPRRAGGARRGPNGAQDAGEEGDGSGISPERS